MKEFIDKKNLVEKGVDYIAGLYLGSLEKKILKSVARLNVATPKSIGVNIKETKQVNAVNINHSIARLVKKNMLIKSGKYKGCTITLTDNAKELAIKYLLINQNFG
jgi:predicted transcriptional regulator